MGIIIFTYLKDCCKHSVIGNASEKHLMVQFRSPNTLCQVPDTRMNKAWTVYPGAYIVVSGMDRQVNK